MSKEPTTVPGPEMFRQTKACEDCPFRKEGGVRHGQGAAIDYASHFLIAPGSTFPCHKSVPKDDDREEWSAWRKGQTLCAGGLIFAEKHNARNGIMHLGFEEGWYDPTKLEETDTIFDTFTEMMIANKGVKP